MKNADKKIKLRFWQKAYLLTLALFLLCINGGILSLTVYTHGENVKAAEEAAKAQQYYVAVSFERDMEYLAENGGSAALLMEAFGAHYKDKGLFIAFEKDGVILYSDFPEAYEIEGNSLRHADLTGKRHILISSEVCGGDYRLVVAKNVESLDEAFRSLMVTYLLTALGVSLFLAVCLYFVLRKLSKPLDSLRKTTLAIGNGDFSVTAEERGNDEFTRLAESFNAMLETINRQMADLEDQAEKKQMLVDDMAHELRTPLTSIYGYAEILEKTAVTEEQRVTASRYIMSQAKRLQKISQILLDEAFIRGNPPEMGEVALHKVLADAAEKLEEPGRRRGVTLSFQGEGCTVWGNETLLSMLFYNLAENALKACSDGGQVVLSCHGNTATVKDNGKGMTAEQMARVTEPFYRTDKSRSRADGGAGLGLALCKRIADAHGAEMKFSSRLGEGTEVSLTFTTRQ